MRSIIAESDLTQVIFRHGKRHDRLLVTFSDMGMVANGNNFWADSFVEKTDTPALGFVGKFPHWFPLSDTQALIGECAPILRRFENVFSYGFSMGGYAALKYSRALGAARALAFSPQWSIDPRDVAAFEPDLINHYNPQLNSFMKIDSSDLCDSNIVVFDPLFRPDRGHYQNISSCGTVHPVMATGMGHHSVHVLSETGGADHFLSLAFDCADVKHAALRRKLRTLRKSSSQYWRGMCKAALLTGRPKLALQAIDTALRLQPNHPGSLEIRDKIVQDPCSMSISCHTRGQDTALKLSVTGFMPPKIAEIAPSWTSSVLSIRPKTGWPTFNPSICWNGTEIVTVIRTANYRLGPQWYSGEMLSAPLDLSSPDPQDPRTVNYIGSLSEGLEWLRAPIPIVLPEGCGDPAWRERIEDCRLIMVEGVLFAVATIYDRASGNNLMGLVRLGDDAGISAVLTLASPLNNPREKNWMPLVRGKTLHLVYSCRPVIVVTVDFSNNTVSTRKVEDGPEELRGWAGSSQGCDIDGSMLCIVHRKVVIADRLYYSHRFVMFDEDLHIRALSAPFIFQHEGVEFCAGMTRVRDRLYVSYGVNDNAAMIGSLSVEEALNSLVWRRPA